MPGKRWEKRREEKWPEDTEGRGVEATVALVTAVPCAECGAANDDLPSDSMRSLEHSVRQKRWPEGRRGPGRVVGVGVKKWGNDLPDRWRSLYGEGLPSVRLLHNGRARSLLVECARAGFFFFGAAGRKRGHCRNGG